MDQLSAPPALALSAIIVDHCPTLCLQISPENLDTFYSWQDASGQPKSRTLLHLAATYSAADCLEALLASGANPNLPSPDDGETPLHCACIASATPKGAKVIALLLKFGADKQLRCKQFCLPSDRLGQSMPQPVQPTELSGGKPELCKECYQTDDFRMFSFKVEACPMLGEMHNWTDCPYLHPGEKARRRDPRVFPYQAIPCPEFRKGNCKRGDGCPFAHGVFECWLHPSRYRTQLCKEGTACARSICFFAHTVSQLREPSQPAIHLTPVITTMPRKDKSATIKAGACAGAGCTSGDGSSSRPGSPGSTLHGGVTPSSCATSRCASPGATAAAEIALRQVFAAKSEESISSPTISDCSTVETFVSGGTSAFSRPAAATVVSPGEGQLAAVATAAAIRSAQQQQQAAVAAAAAISRLFKIPSGDVSSWVPQNAVTAEADPTPAPSRATMGLRTVPSFGMLDVGDAVQLNEPSNFVAELTAVLAASHSNFRNCDNRVDSSTQAAAVQRLLAGLGI